MMNGSKYPFNTGSMILEGAGRINYVDEGKGSETIVFIHGLANYALGWKGNIEALSKHYRCIAIDLPGNGLSDHGNYPYGISYFSGIVASFIKTLGLGPVVLAGHSMGGQVALTTAINHPELVKKLVLCAPAGFEVFSQWDASMYQTSISVFDYFSTEQNSLTKSIQSSFYHYTSQADDMISDLVKLIDRYPMVEYRAMLNACIHGMLHEQIYDSLHLIQAPTLIIFGERDALIPTRALHPTTTRKIAEDGASRIPNSELHLIPSCGHFVQWEKAAEVNELIEDFIK